MTRPNIQIPKEFAINGEKSDFTQEKIQTGFDKLNPDIFAGDNINKFIDDTYKGLNGVLDLYNGVVLHEMTTTYDDKAVVGKFIENRFKLYRSLVNDNTGHEVTETEYWEEVALGGGSGFNLFDTKISDHILEGNEALGWALQGTYVYKEAIAGSRFGYANFYNKCLAEKENSTATETTLGDNAITMYVNANGHKFYDIADKDVVDTWYNTYGIADFYGVDTENERIFLPRNDYFVQLTGDTSKVNKTIEAGLPNITGVVSSDMGSGADGAFNWTSTGANKTGGPTAFGKTTFDASRSNDIYGNSDTVQPPSILKLLYYCVGNTKVESAVSNVTEITTSENDTLPLFHNFYSKEDMTTTGAYVNASLGTYLSGNVYPTAYNELVNKLGTGNVKSNTDTYTDYDFVVNQDNMTFRLPIKNGQEIMFATGVKGNGMTLGFTNGTLEGGIVNNSGGANIFEATLPISVGSPVGSVIQPYAQTFGITTDPTKSGIVLDTENITIPYGWNLYYKVANAVTNLELLDASKVMNAINNVIPNNPSLISSYSMPSDKYIDLTLGASGSTYTAPANGYFQVCGVGGTDNVASALGIYLASNNENFTNSPISARETSWGVQFMCVTLPVTKGDIVGVNWSDVTFIYSGYSNLGLKFIYAEGEV